MRLFGAANAAWAWREMNRLTEGVPAREYGPGNRLTRKGNTHYRWDDGGRLIKNRVAASHSCNYCYARPSHEYLDLGAGTDFDPKIVIKPQAAQLLRDAFDKSSWKGELVMFSGVTDCYQPVEAELKLTRQCLEVCLEYQNPVAVISKGALVERDIELFTELAKRAGFHLSVSLAFVDDELARKIEPWAASPSRRLKVIETMAKADIPVGVMCAPVIPGLNDDQMIRVLERAKDAGATSAGWVLLRLPGVVKEVFEERVRIALPLAADKILHRIRQTRGGEKLFIWMSWSPELSTVWSGRFRAG